MMDNIGLLIIWLISFYIIFNGLIWITIHSLLKKNKLVNIILKFAVSIVVLLIPIIFAFYFTIKKYVFILSTAWWIYLIVFIIFYYLLLVSFAFINTRSWKKFIKNIFTVGIKRIYLTLPVLIINLILISIFTVLIYYTLDWIYLNLLITLIVVILLITTKVYWISCLQDEKNNH